MQDFTGVPAVVDPRVAMRVKPLNASAAIMSKETRYRRLIRLLTTLVTVDHFGDDDAFEENVRLKMERNHERYMFPRKWGKQAFSQCFSVVPPGTGICHQVNLEYPGKASSSELQDGSDCFTRTRWWGLTPYDHDNGLGVLRGVVVLKRSGNALVSLCRCFIPDVVILVPTGKLRGNHRY